MLYIVKIHDKVMNRSTHYFCVYLKPNVYRGQNSENFVFSIFDDQDGVVETIDYNSMVKYLNMGIKFVNCNKRTNEWHLHVSTPQFRDSIQYKGVIRETAKTNKLNRNFVKMYGGNDYTYCVVTDDYFIWIDEDGLVGIASIKNPEIYLKKHRGYILDLRGKFVVSDVFYGGSIKIYGSPTFLWRNSVMMNNMFDLVSYYFENPQAISGVELNGTEFRVHTLTDTFVFEISKDFINLLLKLKLIGADYFDR